MTSAAPSGSDRATLPVVRAFGRRARRSSERTSAEWSSCHHFGKPCAARRVALQSASPGCSRCSVAPRSQPSNNKCCPVAYNHTHTLPSASVAHPLSLPRPARSLASQTRKRRAGNQSLALNAAARAARGAVCGTRSACGRGNRVGIDAPAHTSNRRSLLRARTCTRPCPARFTARRESSRAN